MAYYVVSYDNKKYANIPLAKDFLGITDAHLLRISATGEINAVEILDNVMFQMTDSEVKKINSLFAEVNMQDIECSISKLEKNTEREAHPVAKAEVMYIGGFNFVRMNDIKYSDKYNKRARIPHIKVCGNIYVALDAVITGREKDSIVFTSKERK